MTFSFSYKFKFDYSSTERFQVFNYCQNSFLPGVFATNSDMNWYLNNAGIDGEFVVEDVAKLK